MFLILKMELDEIKKELGKKFDPAAFLREQLEKETAPSIKADIRKELIKIIKEKALVKETVEGQCLLTEKGRSIYVELRKSLPSIL